MSAQPTALNPIAWTDEKVATAERLWREGYKSRDIAEMLGHPGARNAVIGKAHRGEWLRSYQVRPEMPPEPPPPPPPVVAVLPVPKPHGVCGHGDCRMTKQPGRDLCDLHIRILICEQKETKNRTKAAA